MKQKQRKAMPYEVLDKHVHEAIREQNAARQHRFDGLLTATADMFRLLESKFGWRLVDFKTFYPNGTLVAARGEGWVPCE